MDSPVLLDTHVWVWLMEGCEGTRPEAVERMERAAEESLLRVSVIAAWEVGILEQRGCVRSSRPAGAGSFSLTFGRSGRKFTLSK